MCLRVLYKHGDCNLVQSMGLLCGVISVQQSAVFLTLQLYMTVVVETLVMEKSF